MTDDPTLPPPDEADADWFRGAVGPVVDRPVPDAWASIRARTDEPAGLVRIDLRASHRRPPWRAVAAVLVLVVGVATAIIVGGPSGDGRHLATSPRSTEITASGSSTSTSTTQPGSASELDPALVLRATPEAATVPAGTAFTVDVTVMNPTAERQFLPPCYPSLLTWWTSQDGKQVAQGGGRAVDCWAEPTSIDPGQVITVAKPSFLTTTGGVRGQGPALTPGRYQAVIRAGGVDEPIEVPITVT